MTNFQLAARTGRPAAHRLQPVVVLGAGRHQPFRRLDPDLWQATRHNPVEMLGILQQTTLESLKSDEGSMAHLKMVDEKLSEYLTESPEFGINCVGYYTGTHPGFHMDEKMIQSLANLKLAVDWLS